MRGGPAPRTPWHAGEVPRHGTAGRSRGLGFAGPALVVVLLVGVTGWSMLRPEGGVRMSAGTPVAVARSAAGVDPTSPATSSPSVSTPSTSGPSVSTQSVSTPSVSTPSAATPSAPTGSASTRPAAGSGLTAADRAAGLLSRSFPQRASGTLAVVPGTAKAPGSGKKVVTVRVEVEKGLRVDGAKFARFALGTLNDPRSWTHDGYTFARTDGAADVRIVLASPDTSAKLCRPLRTFGTLSCRNGTATVLTVYRWVKGIPEYDSDHAGYRRYVGNHEVGHFLGHGHVSCAGKGRQAPVMMQQTKGLKGCTPNSWPYPDA